MRVAVISANLGGYDRVVDWPTLEARSGVTIDLHRFTDATLPPRPLAMTSRLQCGIPKWFGAEFAPSADVILWIDASCAPTSHAVSWFLDRLGMADVAVFAHPERRTIREEHAFMVRRMARPGETYLNSRYKGEWLQDQFEVIDRAGKAGLPLYASTAFIYRPWPRVQAAFAECFLMKARYLLHDQLALPFVLDKHRCVVNVIPENYLKCEALTFTRKRKDVAA